MLRPLILAGLLAISAPAFAAPEMTTGAIKSDTAPQPTTANDQAVANGTNVQTAQSGQAEDSPASGPQKQGGTVARPAPEQPAAPSKNR